jgi:hypothetical protein
VAEVEVQVLKQLITIKKETAKLLEGIPSTHTLNTNETRLFNLLLPDQVHHFKRNLPCSKQSKECLTITLCKCAEYTEIKIFSYREVCKVQELQAHQNHGMQLQINNNA